MGRGTGACRWYRVPRRRLACHCPRRRGCPLNAELVRGAGRTHHRGPPRIGDQPARMTSPARAAAVSMCDRSAPGRTDSLEWIGRASSVNVEPFGNFQRRAERERRTRVISLLIQHVQSRRARHPARAATAAVAGRPDVIGVRHRGNRDVDARDQLGVAGTAYRYLDHIAASSMPDRSTGPQRARGGRRRNPAPAGPLPTGDGDSRDADRALRTVLVGGRVKWVNSCSGGVSGTFRRGAVDPMAGAVVDDRRMSAIRSWDTGDPALQESGHCTPSRRRASTTARVERGRFTVSAQGTCRCGTRQVSTDSRPSYLLRSRS